MQAQQTDSIENSGAARAGRLVLVLVALAGYAMALRNAFFLSRDVLFGDESGLRSVPGPAFGFYRLHNTALEREYEAVGRLALDFAQVYFPSRNLTALAENYETGAFDPAARPSRYAPLIHYLCAVSLCKLDYGYAALVHLLLQLGLFALTFGAAIVSLNGTRALWVSLCVAVGFIFITPAGLGWFERGQFSLYVAISHLLLILALLKNRLWLVLLSAVFAYVKWTSLPFTFVVLALYILSSRSIREAVQKARPALLYLLVWMVLSLPFMTQLIPFLKGVYIQERFEIPQGFSLAKVLPVGFVKTLPFLLILSGYAYLHQNGRSFERLLPFVIGSGVLLITYPNVTYEYNLPITLAFIPVVLYCTREANRTNGMIRLGALVFLASIGAAYYLFFLGVDAGMVMLGECVIVFVASLFHPLLWRTPVAVRPR